jgi:hypothetical protein
MGDIERGKAMSLILTELNRLFPGTELTSAQRRAIDRAQNPADVAASLKTQARDIRRMFDDMVGPGIATDADVLARMTVDQAISGFGSMSLDWLLQPLGPSRAFELGQATGLIPTLYREELGRAADDAGAAFWVEAWTAQFRAGIR